MAESLKSRLRRWGYNCLPSYRGSGGWITYLADDWREVRVKLPLNLWTRNYYGTLYCGSMYSAVAPFFVAMYYFNLDKQCMVWDKSTQITFRKPGESTLYAHMQLAEAEIAAVKADLETKRATERQYAIDLIDAGGTICVSFETVVYIRRKRT